MKYERKFFQAVREQDIAILQEALESGFPVDHHSKSRLDNDGCWVTPERTGLMWATIDGHRNVALFLLKSGASPHERERLKNTEAFSDETDFRTAWSIAAEMNRPEFFDLFSEFAPPPSNEHLSECLVRATVLGQEDSVRTLLTMGASANNVSAQDLPLSAAARHGHHELVALLLESGATLVSNDGPTQSTIHECIWAPETVYNPLGIAATQRSDDDHLKCLELVLSAGADPNQLEPGFGYPLERMAGCPEGVKMLMNAGADPNLSSVGLRALVETDDDDELPVWSVVRTGSIAKMQALLEAGADINTTDEDGYTPIFSAALRGNAAILRLMVESGAEVNEWVQGDTVLSLAAASGSREAFEYLQTIVNDDISESATLEDVLNAKHWTDREKDLTVERLIDAAFDCPIEMVKAALATGVDVNAVGSRGQTALHVASANGRGEIVALLLKTGAEVNQLTEETPKTSTIADSTALHLVAGSAFAKNRKEIIEQLVAAGANLNLQNAKGETPLMRAVCYASGYSDSIDALLTAGANVTVKNLDGQTALDLAIARKQTALAQKLRDALF